MCSGGATAVGLDLSGLDTDGLLRLAGQVIDRLAADPLSGAVGDEALVASIEGLQRLESRVHAEKLRRIAAVDDRNAARSQGERSTADLVASKLALTPGEARRQTAAAGALARLPKTAARCAAGELTPAHAQAAARTLDSLDRAAEERQRDAGGDLDAWKDAVADAKTATQALDDFAAERATATDASRMSQQLDAWANAYDPDAAAARERRALARRGVFLGEHGDADGIHASRINASAETTATIRAALDAHAAKTGVGDRRTLAQRRHDALLAVLGSISGASTPGQPQATGEAGVDGEPADASQPSDSPIAGAAAVPGAAGAARSKGQFLVVARVDSDTGRYTDAWLDGVGPISSATAQTLACDAEVTIVGIDDRRRVWDVARADGNPSAAQRRAVVARDVACIGCKAHVSRCQLHHIRWRSKHGPTVVDNLVQSQCDRWPRHICTASLPVKLTGGGS